MTRSEALSQLESHAEAIRALGATSLYLYGSTARDKTTPDSDLDLFIEYDPTSSFNALDLVGIKLFLEARIGITVDLTTRDGLHPRLRERIESSATRVF
ncbi:nucleotidyltransferase family protein [Methylobacterium oxalidis]|uniref:nucleotidyltransferase family protein n=1 Tax=Methylobacterium oxalidis TaxID=944322 RepID=UPI003314D083